MKLKNIEFSPFLMERRYVRSSPAKKIPTNKQKAPMTARDPFEIQPAENRRRRTVPVSLIVLPRAMFVKNKEIGGRRMREESAFFLIFRLSTSFAGVGGTIYWYTHECISFQGSFSGDLPTLYFGVFCRLNFRAGFRPFRFLF